MFVKCKGVGQIKYAENNKDTRYYLSDIEEINTNNTKYNGQDRGNIVNP